jgi:AmiR/NasT family two-component response regulator
MIVDELAIGALNVYHREPREWPADDMADAQLVADMATGYIINAFTLRRGVQLADNLTHALESRVVIEQAKGVVAERHHIATDVAFERLRTHARSHRLRIHDAARDVVSGALDV